MSDCISETEGDSASPILTIAVLMTTFNRLQKTIRCLDSLYGSSFDRAVDIRVFLVDASSTDGTADVIADMYREKKIEVYTVSSDHYWAMGMRYAWTHAQAIGYDQLLWLNDDVVLYSDSLNRMLSNIDTAWTPSVAIGALINESNGEISYSGYRRKTRARPLDVEMVTPGSSAKNCDTMNGNVVLVPAQVDRMAGGFPESYIHALADFAYGFEIRKLNIQILLVPGVVGVCERDEHHRKWLDRDLHVWQRLREVAGPKALPPKTWIRYCLKYGGPLGILNGIKPYVSAVLPYTFKKSA